ncbi:ATP-dependent protease, partial [Escherichia coli]|nr:ATP-dependent protease [Escherichia coli]
IPSVVAARREQRRLIIAEANAREAALTAYDQVFSAGSLRQVCDYLLHQTPLDAMPALPPPSVVDPGLDWSDVKGQYHAKQAMVIAACGGHSLLLSGPPGSGKTMLAKRFTTLLPELNETQALECAAIHSLRGKVPPYEHWRIPPFRSPHHTASP